MKKVLLLLLLPVLFFSCREDEPIPVITASLEKNSDASISIKWVTTNLEADYFVVHRFTDHPRAAEVLGETGSPGSKEFTEELVPIWSEISFMWKGTPQQVISLKVT